MSRAKSAITNMVTEMTMSIQRLIWCALLGILLLPSIARAQEVVVYYHTDAIGSVRAMTDETGTVIHRYDFLPFGEAWLPPPNSDTRQFAGKERDRETGLELDYFGARYHLPLTGRFTTVDPVMDTDAAMVDPQRWNRYSYVTNNPFRFIDPDGRDRIEIHQNQLARAYARGEITYAQLRSGMIGEPSALKAGIAATVLTGGAAAELGLMAEAAIWGRGLITAAVGWALTRPNQVQEAATIAAEAVSGAPGFSRPLAAADLGVAGSLTKLSGNFSLRNGAATVSIDMIEGNIRNPFQIVRNLEDTARRAGATSLRIQGTIANEKLYNLLKARYGLRTEGGRDFFDLVLR